jgi:uncharacterized oxidoreductase
MIIEFDLISFVINLIFIMKLSSNVILITGGSSGVGFALAKRFSNAGSEVIICGRDSAKLSAVKKKFPKIVTLRSDLSIETERISLYENVIKDFPRMNILVNNAGIQQRINFTSGAKFGPIKQEIEINLLAQIHLTALFIPNLKKASEPAIINVTSGLAFAPLANVPVYCATKAAFHSFTLSLRYQLSKTPVKVFEVIPPSVQTDLGGKGWHDSGTPLNEFADAVVKGLKQGSLEITYGYTSYSSRASRNELDELFKQMNR